MKSQNEKILNYLKKGKSITAITALRLFKSFRLAARISNLRAAGNQIKKTTVHKGGKSFAKYSL